MCFRFLPHLFTFSMNDMSIMTSEVPDSTRTTNTTRISTPSSPPSASPKSKRSTGNRISGIGFTFDSGYSSFLSSGFKAMVRHAHILGRRNKGARAKNTGNQRQESEQRISFLEFPLPTPQTVSLQYQAKAKSQEGSRFRGRRRSMDVPVSHLDEYWKSEPGKAPMQIMYVHPLYLHLRLTSWLQRGRRNWRWHVRRH